MRRFFKTLIAYLLLLAALTAGINALYVRRLPPKDTDKYRHVPETLDLCNFGSSHEADAFYYEAAPGKSGFNFAMGSQSLGYDDRLLHYYIDRVRPGGTVYLGVSYFSFFGLPETHSKSFASKNKRYYDFLPAEYILDYNPKIAFFEKYAPALTVDEGLFKTLFFPDPVIDFESMTIDAETAAQQAPSRYETHFVEDQFDENGQRIRNEGEYQALLEMIALCKERSLEPILVTTPLTAEYCEQIDRNAPEFYDEFYAIMDRICEETGVRYFDYSRDERFSHAYELFCNIDHLNRAGGLKFTEIVLADSLGEQKSP